MRLAVQSKEGLLPIIDCDKIAKTEFTDAQTEKRNKQNGG